MKNMKSKLLASVAMLLVSAIMLTSASFAWFTISTAPEITDLETQVVVNENLEIALASTGHTGSSTGPAASALGDTGNAYTWGNIVDLGADGAAKNAYTSLNKELRPAALTAGVFQYPTYGTDGRLNAALTNLTEGAMADGFGNLTGENGHFYGYYVDFWLRSNKDGDVALTAAAGRGAGESGEGSTFTANNNNEPDKVLAKNIKIAFKDLTGTGTATPASETYTDGANSKVFTGNVVTLTANTPKLVRMYVYLDGASVTNAAASLSGTTIGGKLNVQFAMTNVTTPMNVTSAAAGG